MQMVAAGQDWWFSNEVMALINRRHRNQSKGLTRREEEVLSHLADGLSNRQIADKLDISDHTVKNHLNSIFDKIGVNTRNAATNWAFTNGLFPC